MNTKLCIFVWLAGVPGIISVVWLALPILLQGRTLPMSFGTVQVISATQSLVLLAIAAAVGSGLAHKVALDAPLLSAIAAPKSMVVPVSKLLIPGVVGGLAGGLLLLVANRFTPSALVLLQDKYSLPLVTRVLYGGITEEVLCRWGLMTLFVWVLWRLFQGGIGSPSMLVMVSSIVLSAVLFGLGHLPAARAMLGALSTQITLFVIVGNAIFGLVAGYLYWQYGLEAAIVAHIVAHVVAYVVRA